MTAALLRIATRESPLAVWQAEHVRTLLRRAHPGLEVELVRMTTQGDRILDAPLAKIGGKGLFVKELEQSLLDGRADIAVHSMKDVPVELPPGLHLPVVLEREQPYDAFVSIVTAASMRCPRARLGTSSLSLAQLGLRRICRCSAHSNVLRLRRLDEDEFDGIIACAGLIRLGLGARIADLAAIDLSAGDQPSHRPRYRVGDAVTARLISVLDHADTHVCVSASGR